MKTHEAIAFTAATLGMIVAGASSPRAGEVARRKAGPVSVPAGGYLYCVVRFTSPAPSSVAFTLLDATGKSVSAQFGSTLISTEGGHFTFEETRGAFAEALGGEKGGCSVTFDRQRGTTVHLEATAHNAGGETVGLPATSGYAW